MAIYFNGILKASKTPSVSRTGTFQHNLNSGAATAGDLMEVGMYGVFGREWTPTDVQQWYQDPYTFLVPQSPTQRWWVQAQAGGVATPKSLSLLTLGVG